MYIPYAQEIAAMSVINTRTFKSGNSEAVRLPKEVAFGAGTPVTIEKNGDALIIRPVVDKAGQKRAWLAFLDKLAAMPKPPGVERREPIEFPDRPGL